MMVWQQQSESDCHGNREMTREVEGRTRMRLVWAQEKEHGQELEAMGPIEEVWAE